MIKKLIFLVLSLAAVTAYGQSAKSVLDATARKLNAGGTYAEFNTSMQGKNMSGNITIKGNKFKISTPSAITWFDGKTQWTYMKSTAEVTISNPDLDQQQQINPYHFINLYKNGYSAKLTKKNGRNVVTLKRVSGKSNITDAVVEINPSTSYPTLIKIKVNNRWTEFKVTSAKSVNCGTSVFRFNEKQYKNAEIIDLR